MISVLLTLSILGAVSNILFVVIIGLRADVTTTVKSFLYNLAAANIIICVFCFFWDLTTELGILEGTWRCFLQYFGLQISFYSTLGTVCVMNMERLVAVRCPFRYKHTFTIAKRRLVLLTIWCVAVACSLLTLEDLLDALRLNGYVCTPLQLYPRRYALFVVASVCLLYLFTQIIINVVLVCHLFKFSSHTTRHGAARAQRATGITLACSVSYVITITPIAAFEFYCAATDQPLELVLVTPFSIFVNSLVAVITFIDPIIYFVSLRVCDRGLGGRRSRVGNAGHPGVAVVAVPADAGAAAGAAVRNGGSGSGGGGNTATATASGCQDIFSKRSIIQSFGRNTRSTSSKEKQPEVDLEVTSENVTIEEHVKNEKSDV